MEGLDEVTSAHGAGNPLRRPPPSCVPAPCAVFASAAALTIRRAFRRAAIQCRGDNIQTTYRRCLRQPWIASPHNIHYVSQVRWRLRKDGLGEAQPCPGAMRR
ncbi:MAG: hypothetical protein LBM98_08080, partial [Oscillospiraceae bacterium]|nr:hypothetical protein [Oscillospiraceae bacterium]